MTGGKNSSAMPCFVTTLLLLRGNIGMLVYTKVMLLHLMEKCLAYSEEERENTC